VRAIVRKFFADRGTHLAAMIAYFALLSFVPLLFLSLALLGAVGQATPGSFFVRELHRTFPSTSLESILNAVRKIRDLAWPYRARLFLGVLTGVISGLVGPLLIATAMFVYAAVFPSASDNDSVSTSSSRTRSGCSWIGRTYSSTSPRRDSQKSTSISGGETRSGFKNRSKSNPYFSGSTSVIPST